MKIKIVTNCTARKAKVAPAILRARSLPKGTLAAVAKEWGRRIASAEEKVPAGELYQGRAFREAMRAARLAKTPLTIISAGLGSIGEEDRIPAYSLTVSDDSVDAISRKIEHETFRPGAWWTALRRNGGTSKSLADWVRGTPDALFVLALSSAYLQLVLDEVLSFAQGDLERLRLIGPRRETDLPEELRPIHMPYDDRLDGAKSPIRGTESDFPQRAALHFVQMVHARPVQALEEHKRLVKEALEGWPRKCLPLRKKLPERDLRHAIKGVLRECNGHWSKALRCLRDQHKIACEQKRFKRICDDILRGSS